MKNPPEEVSQCTGRASLILQARRTLEDFFDWLVEEKRVLPGEEKAVFGLQDIDDYCEE